MGETAELRNRLAGTFGLNDFISQGDNEATIPKLLRTMIPTINMRDFQRRFRFSSGSQALAIGEFITVEWTVPRTEFWLIKGIFWENADNAAAHVYSVEFSINRSRLGDLGNGVARYRAVFTSIELGDSKVIYGDFQNNDSSANAYNQFLDVTLEPEDSVRVVVGIPQAAAIGQRWTMLYELVPGTSATRTRGVAAVRTIT